MYLDSLNDAFEDVGKRTDDQARDTMNIFMHTADYLEKVYTEANTLEVYGSPNNGTY